MQYGYDMNNLDIEEEIEIFSNPVDIEPIAIPAIIDYEISTTQDKSTQDKSTNDKSRQMNIEIMKSSNYDDPFSEITQTTIQKLQLSDYNLLKQNIINYKTLTPSQLVQLYSLTEFEKIEIILLYNKICSDRHTL